MALERAEVLRIAGLARLALPDEAVAAYTQDLSAILDLVARMEAVDTASIEPMAHPRDAVQRLRADEVTESVERGRFLHLAPMSEAGLYLVPKVIE